MFAPHNPPYFLTSAQMRALEQREIAAGRADGAALMERAGQQVVSCMLEGGPAAFPASGMALVLCGPGNNGGDGYVIARLLARRGWQVTCASFGALDRLPKDAAHMMRLWRDGGGRIVPLDGRPPPDMSQVALAVDALFGTGLTRPLPAELAPVIDAWDKALLQNRVAVDVPSGLCADSGRVLGGAGGVFRADLTVTFHSAKPGHVLARAPEICGRVCVADIGLRSQPPEDAVARIDAPKAEDLRKTVHGHKFRHGHALVLTGPRGRSGAGRLAARGAMRVGAGLVTLAPPPDALDEVAAQVTSAMVQAIPDSDDLARCLEDPRITALCLGPGLGITPREAALVQVALKSGRPLVLDADALTLVAQSPWLRQALHDRCVLTPHMGEFARLCPDLAQQVSPPEAHAPAMSMAEAARQAAKRLGATVLLKGPATVIAAPSGAAALHDATGSHAAPWLATGGAGDVLAGMITGLVARGLPIDMSASAAVWMHAAAARRFGPGLIAEDLPDTLPAILRALGV